MHQSPHYEPQLQAAINVGQDERKVSLLGGGVLLVLALRQHGLLRIPALLAGLGLIYQGMTGKSPLIDALNRNTTVNTNSGRVSVPHEQGVHVTRAVTIDRPVEALYNFWRDPANLPQVMFDAFSRRLNKEQHYSVVQCLKCFFHFFLCSIVVTDFHAMFDGEAQVNCSF